MVKSKTRKKSSKKRTSLKKIDHTRTMWYVGIFIFAVFSLFIAFRVSPEQISDQSSSDLSGQAVAKYTCDSYKNSYGDQLETDANVKQWWDANCAKYYPVVKTGKSSDKLICDRYKSDPNYWPYIKNNPNTAGWWASNCEGWY